MENLQSPAQPPPQRSPPPIIGLCGKFGVGKDTAADWIHEEYPQYQLAAFAVALKEVVSIMTNTSLNSQFTREGKAHIPSGLTQSVGYYQQQVGQSMREIFGKDIWVNIVMNEIGKTLQPTIITDVRYPNEVDAILAAGGIVIRITRPNVILNDGRDPSHSSETALDDYTFKYVIENDGTIDDFRTKVLSILK